MRLSPSHQPGACFNLGNGARCCPARNQRSAVAATLPSPLQEPSLETQHRRRPRSIPTAAPVAAPRSTDGARQHSIVAPVALHCNPGELPRHFIVALAALRCSSDGASLQPGEASTTPTSITLVAAARPSSVSSQQHRHRPTHCPSQHHSGAHLLHCSSWSFATQRRLPMKHGWSLLYSVERRRLALHHNHQ